jgi:transposase
VTPRWGPCGHPALVHVDRGCQRATSAARLQWGSHRCGPHCLDQRRAEVRLAWHAKETIRGIYAIDDPDDADRFVTEVADDMTDPDHPIEVRSLGRTLRRWHDQIVAWHHARVSNGPTEAVNNLIERIKRIGFGFRRFAHYRLRVLLYAGRPNWNLIGTIDPAEIR